MYGRAAQPNPTGRRGVTLMELVVALFLIAIVIRCIGLVLNRSYKVLRLMKDQDTAQQAVRMGLERLTDEAREATFIVSAGNSNLTFQKIDPNATVSAPPDSFTNAAGHLVVPSWTPQDAYPASDCLRVHYYLDTSTRQLVRAVQRLSGGAVATQVVASGISAFTCSQPMLNSTPPVPGYLKVTLTVIDHRGRVLTLSSEVVSPCCIRGGISRSGP